VTETFFTTKIIKVDLLILFSLCSDVCELFLCLSFACLLYYITVLLSLDIQSTFSSSHGTSEPLNITDKLK